MNKVYSTKLPIKSKNINNLKSLILYIPEKKNAFYTLIFGWPTTASEEQIDEDD